jgi:hypothetical protein
MQCSSKCVFVELGLFNHLVGAGEQYRLAGREGSPRLRSASATHAWRYSGDVLIRVLLLVDNATSDKSRHSGLRRASP